MHYLTIPPVLDYYKYSYTTANDMIEFEAGILTTASCSLNSGQGIGINILLDEIEVWKSNITITVKSTEVNTQIISKYFLICNTLAILQTRCWNSHGRMHIIFPCHLDRSFFQVKQNLVRSFFMRKKICQCSLQYTDDVSSIIKILYHSSSQGFQNRIKQTSSNPLCT
jgi:hypothetical protein